MAPRRSSRPGFKDHLCPACGKLLGRYRVAKGGEIVYETKCRFCKAIIVLEAA